MSDYTVTVSLTNPISPSDFYDCNIYAIESASSTDNEIFEGIPIGAISSPTGSTVVEIDSSLYGVAVFTRGVWGQSYDATNVSTTGGVLLIGQSPMFVGTSKYSVTTDGTITIDGIDYGD